jgi:N-acetylmuramoyl-L-alanine amidase
MVRFFIMFFAVCTSFLLSIPVAQAADFGDRVADMAEINGLRVSSSEKKVRVVVDMDKSVDFTVSALSAPGRVVVNIPGAWLSPQVKKNMDIGSRFAGRVRIAQFDKNTVRIVVETGMGKDNYRIFSLSGGASPYRIVMDFGDIGPSSAGAEIKFPSEDAGSTAARGTQESGSSVGTAPAAAAGNVSGGTAAVPAEEQPEPAFSPGISGKKITIDPGHGGSDSGAIGPTGVTEKSVTLRVAMEVQRLLTAAGAQVYMTRTADVEVSPKRASATDDEELQARCDIANQNQSDLFLSIHMDSFTTSDARGTTGYYYAKGTAAGQQLADAVRAGVVARLGTESRGTKSCNFYVVKYTRMPATLVELAFISNAAEEKLMNADDGIHKAAQGIVDGIGNFFGK